MLLSLVLACGGSITAGDPPTGGDPAGDSAPPADTGAYVVDDDTVEPALSLDEVAAAVTTAVDAAHRLDAAALFDSYDGAMSGRSASCPYTNADYAAQGVDYWYDNCTADSGSHYSGYGYGYHYTDWWSGSQYHYRHNGYWFGDAKIDLPDGSTTVGSGYAYFYDYDDTYYGGTGYAFSIFGEFASSSPLWADTWLGDDLSVSMSLSWYHYGDDPGQLQVNGGVSHLPGSINAVNFDHVYVLSEANGSECTLEPGGTISVRDESGDWYDVAFQGPAPGSTTAFPAECDGCGVVWFRGQEIGEVCPDLSTLIAWGS